MARPCALRATAGRHAPTPLSRALHPSFKLHLSVSLSFIFHQAKYTHGALGKHAKDGGGVLL